ncbi:hypothetical protein, partial [Frigoribacterium faeni]
MVTAWKSARPVDVAGLVPLEGRVDECGELVDLGVGEERDGPPRGQLVEPGEDLQRVPVELEVGQGDTRVPVGLHLDQAVVDEFGDRL